MTSAKPEAPHPSTEGTHPLGALWAEASTEQALAIFARADAEAVRAVRSAHRELGSAIDAIAERMGSGGRLLYVGAGTSGRLGALDAAECPPTFRSDPNQVVALLAGGPTAMWQAIEGAEDDRKAGAQAVRDCEPEQADCVLGISASGGAPFVHGALEAARQVGAWTGLLVCTNQRPDIDAQTQVIRLATGAELLSGSTRMKAGSATKMALNAISTLVMARLGKVHGHRMVDVATAGNRKLWRRGIGLVRELTGLDLSAAEDALEAAGGAVKVAVLMQSRGWSREVAEAQLRRHRGHLAAALASQ